MASLSHSLSGVILRTEHCWRPLNAKADRLNAWPFSLPSVIVPQHLEQSLLGISMQKIRKFIRKNLWAGVCLFALPASAQNEITEIIKTGPQDAFKLASAYFEPAFRGFGSGMNSNWYNTARTHRPGGFSITLASLNVAFAPNRDRSFDVRELGLKSEYARLKNPESDFTAPTILGKDQPGAEFGVYIPNPNTGEETEVASFRLPEGSGIHFVPVPMIQANAGLFKGTEVAVRLIPKIKPWKNYGSIQLYGGGLKHDIKQYIPGIRRLPFDLSLMAGFTFLQYELPLDLSPPEMTEPASGSPGDYTTQRLEAQFKGLTTNLILSKTFSVITLYGSAGYNFSETGIHLRGTYPVVSNLRADGVVEYEDFTDPVSFRSRQGKGVKANAGFRLQLAIFMLYAEGALADYPSVSAGVGLSFGK